MFHKEGIENCADQHFEIVQVSLNSEMIYQDAVFTEMFGEVVFIHNMTYFINFSSCTEPNMSYCISFFHFCVSFMSFVLRLT